MNLAERKKQEKKLILPKRKVTKFAETYLISLPWKLLGALKKDVSYGKIYPMSPQISFWGPGPHLPTPLSRRRLWVPCLPALTSCWTLGPSELFPLWQDRDCVYDAATISLGASPCLELQHVFVQVFQGVDTVSQIIENICYINRTNLSKIN